MALAKITIVQIVNISLNPVAMNLTRHSVQPVCTLFWFATGSKLPFPHVLDVALVHS